MTPKPIEQALSAVQRGSWPALLRAAQRAREVAIQTGTPLAVNRDGQLVLIPPEELRAQRDAEQARQS